MVKVHHCCQGSNAANSLCELTSIGRNMKIQRFLNLPPQPIICLVCYLPYSTLLTSGFNKSSTIIFMIDHMVYMTIVDREHYSWPKIYSKLCNLQVNTYCLLMAVHSTDLIEINLSWSIPRALGQPAFSLYLNFLAIDTEHKMVAIAWTLVKISWLLL
jgi:hypothetical protein